ncbi:MAG TPA: phosphate signaling complex protein PhoU [Frankiaceae bacterium]|nr:phosphate signaling complex protein PhoU [Frankiaceae bacterium]
MRDAYHDDLNALTQSMVEMTRLVSSAVARATTALLDADLELAERVISGDAAVDAQYRDAEERAFDLLARQAPVAGDLRRIVASLRMVSDLERGGDLAVHIAEVARRRYPASAIPAALRSTMLEMGQIGERIMTKAGSIIVTSDLVLAEQIEQEDDVVDSLHRQLFRVLLEDDWDGSVEAAVDITLCSRFYERIADHAVGVARRVVYLVTGLQPAEASL